jgi:FlaA1/EpsC-like NDP-sugar epimerase
MKSVLRHFSSATLIGVVLFIIFQVIYFFNGRNLVIDETFWSGLLDHMIFSWLIYMANALLISYLLNRFGMKLFTGKLLAMSVLGNIMVSLVAIFMARSIISLGLRGNDFTTFLKGESIEYYLNTSILAVCISGIFYAFFYYKHRQETKVKEQKIIAGTASAQFDALKNQLDPHFLFNSLNVLTSLIE